MLDAHGILHKIIGEYADADKWNDAPFEGIKRISNTHVGSIGQDFVESICKEIGFYCAFPANLQGGRSNISPWDIKIESVKFELKTATEDVNGAFQFNHIRYHRPYEGVICLGISPGKIYFNLWSKAEIVTGVAGNLVSMEKGANASYKLTKKPNALHVIHEFKAIVNQFINKF